MSSYENARHAETFGSDQQGGLGIEGGCVPPSFDNYSNENTGDFAHLTLSKQPDEELMVTFDSAFYSVKPQKYEFAAITSRVQRAGFTICTPAEFCDHVKRGGTWVGGTYEPCDNGWGKFHGQQLFGLDFDNGSHGAPLAPGEPGFLDPLDALNRCDALGLDPLCLYFTMGTRNPDQPRYRLVFDMGLVSDMDEARAIVSALLHKFPEADQLCKKPNRLFLGSQGEVWECWRIWGDRDV